MWAVTAGGPGYVAVGSDDSDGDDDAAVWTSPDGVAWTRIRHDETNLGGSSWQEMYAVAATDSGVVAVGATDAAAGPDAAPWISPDGLTWTRVPGNLFAFTGESAQVMTAVVATEGGFVAAGLDWSGGDQDAAAWTSPDGLTWTRSEDDESVFGGDDHQWMGAVVVSDGGVVAIGYDGSENEADAAVWTSPDGVTWTRVPDGALGSPSRQEMLAVVATPDGLVAVGFDDSGGDGDAAVWTSPDGSTWARVAHDEAIFGGTGNQGMGGVALTSAGVTAVGVYDSNGDGDMVVWISPSG
jgi:hypothetical protein